MGSSVRRVVETIGACSVAVGVGCVLESNPLYVEGDATAGTELSDSGDGSSSTDSATSGGTGTSAWLASSTDATSSEEGTTGTSCGTGCDTGPSTASSCAELLMLDPDSASGVYAIDPDGEDGPAAALEAYCDMAGAGGGWTLVMKAVQGSSTLQYSSGLWWQPNLLNELDLTPNEARGGADAKFVAFNEIRGQTLRLGWKTSSFEHDFFFHDMDGRTALELFTGDEILVAGDETDACHGPLLSGVDGYLAPAMLMGLGHQFYGINGIDNGGGSTYGTIRFGFGANNEMNYAWYGRFGIGADSRSVFWNSPVDDCGSCGCYGSPGDPEFYAANLWVR